MSLAVPAVLLIVAVVCALVPVCWRLANLPVRRRPYQSGGHQHLDLDGEDR